MTTSKQEILLSSSNTLFKTKLRQILGCLRDELDDHRDTINENTTEIETNHGYLREMNQKIEKVNSRLDELFLLITGKKQAKEFKISPLTKREKEVFHALYSLGEGVNSLTYQALARKLSISVNLIAQYITNMVEKGVPITKKYCKSKAHIQLDPEFRKKQAKDNIIGLNSRLSCWA